MSPSPAPANDPALNYIEQRGSQKDESESDDIVWDVPDPDYDYDDSASSESEGGVDDRSQEGANDWDADSDDNLALSDTGDTD